MRRVSSARSAARILQPRLGAGARLALVGHRSLGGAQVLGRLPVRGVGGGERIGGGLAVLLGGRTSLISVWRCCSIMAGRAASLAISASASAVRSLSAAIC